MRDFNQAGAACDPADHLPGSCPYLRDLALNGVVQGFAVVTNAETGPRGHQLDVLSLLDKPRCGEQIGTQRLAGGDAVLDCFANRLRALREDARRQAAEVSRLCRQVAVGHQLTGGKRARGLQVGSGNPNVYRHVHGPGCRTEAANADVASTPQASAGGQEGFEGVALSLTRVLVESADAVAYFAR